MSSEPSARIETVLQEERVFKPSQSLGSKGTISGIDQYQKMVASAKADPDRFWGDAALKELHWFKPFQSVLNWSNPPFAKWFEGGRTNVSYNCLDRHIINGKGEKTAIIWEGEPGEVRRITYRELFEEVCKTANALKDLGIGKGDLVKRVSDGTIDRDAGTSTLPDTGTLGIFMGCQYTDPNTSQLTFNNQYPGSIVASDIDAFVVDDPDVVMKVAVCSSGTTMATVARTVIGNNVAIISNTLNTTNGRGKLAVSSSPAATLTLPLKIIDVVEDTKTGSDAFQEVLVVFNAPYEDSNIQKMFLSLNLNIN